MVKPVKSFHFAAYQYSISQHTHFTNLLTKLVVKTKLAFEMCYFIIASNYETANKDVMSINDLDNEFEVMGLNFIMTFQERICE